MFELNSDHDLKIVNNIGNDNRNAVVIDNFYANPDKVRSLALKSPIERREDLIDGIPGKRSFVETGEVKDKLKNLFDTFCLDESLWKKPIDVYRYERQWDCLRGFMCNVMNDEYILVDPWLNLPHQDSSKSDYESPNQFGVVIYLNTPEECAGGTNLFSYKGMMSLPCSVGQFMDKPEGFDDEVSETSQIFPYIHRWINGDREWKVEHRFDMVYNRCVVYESDVLHSPDIDTGMFTDYNRVNQVMFL
tara:strand:+ start:5068 stop:5808 length:741 start_codon:yes stop_codon:yes gene_type:complete